MDNLFSTLMEQSLDLPRRWGGVGLQFLLTTGSLMPGITVLGAIWFWLSASLRRQHRARCFIDLLEIGLRQGRTVEETIRSLSAQRVSELGVGLHLLAAWLERGLRLGAALKEVRTFLPANVTGMLRAGEEIGDLAKVLPVCRTALQDAPSMTLKGVNNLVVLLLISSPIGPFLVWALQIWVAPRFQQLASDMSEGGPPGVVVAFDGLWSWAPVLAGVSLVVWTLFWLPATLAWCVRRFLPQWSGIPDRITCWLPWARSRMQRDFSRMLSLLLDAGLPEAEAVAWAARSTGNRAFEQRGAPVLQDLKKGVKLTEAVRRLDEAGEFKWRLDNAAQGDGRFSAALAGWHEALDAKAFQQEQLFSQAASTGLVLLNGFMVAIVTVSIFQILTGITELALW
jgi:type II secretory pathway component PulF